MNLTNIIQQLATVDLFARDPSTGDLTAGTFLGRPFYLDYTTAHLLVADARKNQAHGVPQGALLLAYYENNPDVRETFLLRVLAPSPLPTDADVVRAMIEYYKDDLRTTGSASELDEFTRFEFSFSGVHCHILGTFYLDVDNVLCFGADVETFYSAHHYRVLQPNPAVLELIVNYRESGITGRPTDVRIGHVRYSSSQRAAAQQPLVPVYIDPRDFLGQRTALFGMTRTGKSNTVKKLIQATVQVSALAPERMAVPSAGDPTAVHTPFTPTGLPRYPVGQIIFDINGEYANANQQDAATAIFELYQEQVTRYSTLPKPGFKELKVNFYRDIVAGFDLAREHLARASGNYVASFRNVDMRPPVAYASDFGAKTRYDRKVAAYLCCLEQAGLPVPAGFQVKFTGNATLNQLGNTARPLDPQRGLTLSQATQWFTRVWAAYDSHDFFTTYQKEHNGAEWADEDLKAILVFLTQRRRGGGNQTVDGYIRLRGLQRLHTPTVSQPFTQEILRELRQGRIIIIDLSQGDAVIQRFYAARICQDIFQAALQRFIHNQPNNFIQFVFEEAHNLFPKKDDPDLSQVYHRLAKEGAKLHLGLLYLTQEVSSISASILKNTQNWFIAHLNNEDETREIRKYYDFGDFASSLVRFSEGLDKGFVRMKTYSNPFVVPVQIDRFVKEDNGSIA